MKVWLSAVVAAPVTILIYETISCYSCMRADDSFGFILLLMIFGFVFSIPSAACLWLAAHVVYQSETLSLINQKLILTAISIALSLAPFMALFHSWELVWRSDSYMFIIYMLCIIAGIWYYHFSPLPSNETNNNENNNTINC